jgi:ABC-type transporter MlaC component
MFKNKQLRWPILLILTVFLITACATFQNMTPAKKYATTRTAFNELVKSYIAQAKMQPEDVRAKLRTEVNPVIKDAEAALDKYYESLTLPNDDPDARLAFYLDLKTEILNLCLKYGLKIKTE